MPKQQHKMEEELFESVLDSGGAKGGGATAPLVGEC